MSLRAKKIVVVAALGTVILLTNVWAFADLLDRLGVVALAQRIRSEYITGTAVAVILTLLFLLGSSSVISVPRRLARQCPVCDHLLLRRGKYCGACGSRV